MSCRVLCCSCCMFVCVTCFSSSTNSVDRQNQTHAATHNICGLCVPRRRCPVVQLSLRLKRESELQAFCCDHGRNIFSIVLHMRTCIHTKKCLHACMHTCIYKCMRRHTYILTYMHAYMHAHIHLHTYKHTCIHMYAHACIHTHTYLQPCINTHIVTYMHTYNTPATRVPHRAVRRQREQRLVGLTRSLTPS